MALLGLRAQSLTMPRTPRRRLGPASGGFTGGMCNAYQPAGGLDVVLDRDSLGPTERLRLLPQTRRNYGNGDRTGTGARAGTRSGTRSGTRAGTKVGPTATLGTDARLTVMTSR